MKFNEKSIAAVGLAGGITAGLAFCLPAIIKGRKVRMPIPREALAVKGREIVNTAGETVLLTGLAPLNCTLDISDRQALNNRFGTYGQAQVVKVHDELMLTKGDIDFAGNSGINCVRISFTNCALNYRGHIDPKKFDFERLDSLLECCSENGVYAILNLCDATSFDKKEKQEKNYLTILSALAKHFAGNPYVAGIDLTCPDISLKYITGGKPSDYVKFLKKCIGTVRKQDPDRIMLIPAPLTEGKIFFDLNTFSGKNCCAIYENKYMSHVEFFGVLENITTADMPCFMAINSCKPECVTRCTENGFIPLLGDFKGFRSADVIFNIDAPAPDFAEDSYDTIIEKYTKNTAKAIKLNDSAVEGLKAVDCITEKAHDKKFRFSAGLRAGKNCYRIER